MNKRKVPSNWKLMSLGEAAESIGVCTKTLRSWCDNGYASYSRTPGGHRKISGREVMRLRGVGTGKEAAR